MHRTWILSIISLIPLNAHGQIKLSPQLDFAGSNSKKLEYSKVSLESLLSEEYFKIGTNITILPFVQKNYLRGSNIFLDTEYGKFEFGNRNSAFFVITNSWRNIFTDRMVDLKPINISYYSSEKYGWKIGTSYSNNPNKFLDLGVSHSFEFKKVDFKISTTSKVFEQNSKPNTALSLSILSSYGPYIFAISFGSLENDYKHHGLSSMIAYVQGPITIFTALERTKNIVNINFGINYKFSKYLTPYVQISSANKENIFIAGISFTRCFTPE
jgi:hypothetical protein